MRIINTHAHWYPQEWVDLLEKEGADNGAVIGRNARGEVTFNKAGTQFRGLEDKKVKGNIAFRRNQIDIEMRLKAMDDTRVDVQVLSLTTPMVYWAPPAFGLKLSQTFNDACSAIHIKHPDRFLGMAMAPMQAPELAVQEIERASKLPGICGLYMATHINGKNLDEQEFFPVYAKCEELNWPIFLHPGNPIGGERTSKHFLVNLLGNPYDTGIAAASLMFGGVMDAFPKLDVMLPHAGGTFPALIGRMDHGTKMRPEIKHMTKPPSSYLRRFHYDTIAHNSHFLMYMIREIGADRIVLGDDYPADMGYKRPVDVVDELTELTTSERDMILSTNAERLLRLEPVAAR
jgi:aminocarboxymuconate-semialdehyde decarboxylase